LASFPPNGELDTMTWTWLGGAGTIDVDPGDRVWVNVSASIRAYDCPGTTCDTLAGHIAPCYRVGTGTPTVGNDRYFLSGGNPLGDLIPVAADDIFPFYSVGGTYDFGICARRFHPQTTYYDLQILGLRITAFRFKP
jgi:hypothetical protein